MTRLLATLRALPLPGWRAVVLVLVLLGATGFFASIVRGHYPLEHWLFFRYAIYWLCTGVFLAGALGVGQLTLVRVFRSKLPLHEATIAALALGLFEFELAMLLVGIVQRFNTISFFAVPIAFLVGGSSGLRSLARGWLGLYRRSRPHVGPIGLLSIGFGLIVFAMIYFAALTPENVQFDSRWKHMSLAEDWVAWGGIRRRDEGWLFSARPHMTSLLYTWAFLLPNARLFDKMLLCSHLELAIFAVTTLVGIPALVRRLVPRADPRAVWAARFLFPGVLLYDSSVCGGADHIGALFGVPAALCLFRAWKKLELRPTLLLATVLAAAVLVKETIAIMLVPFPALAICARAAWLGIKRLRGSVEPEALRNAWRSPLAALGVALLLTTPLWLENLIWYGDPLYPSLNRFFSPNPWSDAAAYRFRWGYQDAQMWAPERNWEGLRETLAQLFWYSFDPHDWKRFHRDVPVFGSLFTLLLFCLPFVRGTKRIWVLVAWVHLAIFAWYSVHHQDRYLQGVLPLMASVTAAVLLLLWRQFGYAVRGALALLVGFQLVWGGDVYFFQTHAMARSAPKKTLDLLSAGFEKKYDARFNVQSSYQAIGQLLPPKARVLLHETNINLGTGRTTVLDNPGWQYAIEYGETKSPAAVHDLFVKLGVTHVFTKTEKSKGSDSIAGDIRFFDYVRRRASERISVSGGILVPIGKKPEGPFDDSVAMLSCGNDYDPGLYRVTDLATQPFGPRARKLPSPREPATLPEDADTLIDAAEYVVFDPSCFDSPPASLRNGRSMLIKRNASKVFRGYEIWARGALERPQGRSAPVEKDAEQDEDETGGS
ncbi:MAG TPA: hypothetical protein VGK73_20320 [Polyangiaceae bacterium]